MKQLLNRSLWACLFLLSPLLTPRAHGQSAIDFARIDSTETLQNCQTVLREFIKGSKAMVLMEQHYTRKGIAQAFIPIPAGQGSRYPDIYVFYFVAKASVRSAPWLNLYSVDQDLGRRAGSFRVTNAVAVKDGYIFQIRLDRGSDAIYPSRLVSNELQVVSSNPGNLIAFSL
ncbi:hypothetical protein GGR92_004732 [Spirosoma lacussanchae]|uniref:hypothetical protein n=1 Tax=Spirosoma lacussanchae TaxID=1884249 RepID=UPI001107B3C9|nr:hypothetical protein [Spirosoma lacussanchae]